MGVRNSLQSLKTLSTWWGAHSAAPFWNTRFAWEQSALWELWKRSGFATSLRVLQDTRTHRCMRTMDNDDWAGITPVIHIADGASGKKLSKRTDMLRHRLSSFDLRPPWQSMRVLLDAPHSEGRRCLQTLTMDQRNIYFPKT